MPCATPRAGALTEGPLSGNSSFRAVPATALVPDVGAVPADRAFGDADNSATGAGGRAAQACHNNKIDRDTQWSRDVVIAVRVRLRTATFFGYAQLRTAGCEGDARLRTVDHQCIPELF